MVALVDKDVIPVVIIVFHIFQKVEERFTN